MSDFISVTKVFPLENYHLHLFFNTGDEKLFDVTPYLEQGVFRKLKQISFFKTARVANDTVIWGNGEIDFSPDTLYLKSKRSL